MSYVRQKCEKPKRNTDTCKENRERDADDNFRQNHGQEGNCLNIAAHFKSVPVNSDSADCPDYCRGSRRDTAMIRLFLRARQSSRELKSL